MNPGAWQLFNLGLAWAAWSALHSLLLWEPLRGRIEKALGWPGAFYRACYSGLALALFVLLGIFTWRLGGVRPFFWPWPWLLAQAALWALALGLIWWAWWSFKKGGVDLMGWEDAASDHHEPPHLVLSGAYAWFRHPMYLATAVMLWARSLAPADVVTSAVLTVYLGLGTWHEEYRMRKAYGKNWEQYAQDVTLLGPKRTAD